MSCIDELSDFRLDKFNGENGWIKLWLLALTAVKLCGSTLAFVLCPMIVIDYDCVVFSPKEKNCSFI